MTELSLEARLEGAESGLWLADEAIDRRYGDSYYELEDDKLVARSVAESLFVIASVMLEQHRASGVGGEY